jgi:hypothetical protein
LAVFSEANPKISRVLGLAHQYKIDIPFEPIYQDGTGHIPE